MLALAAVCWFFGAGLVSSQGDAKSYAADAVRACAHEGDHSTCYEETVPELYPKLSVSQVFDVIREIRAEDKSYQFCHVLAHKLGERVVAEDPSKWIDAIPLNPADGLCSNGFVHGVTGGRFRSEVLSSSTIQSFIGDFTAACAPRPGWTPSDLDRAICYHGMGHLYDFITNADIPHALSLCAQTTPDDYERMCVEGVFMQIYQPLEPDDFELIKQMPSKPEKDTVRKWCAAFKDPAFVGACQRESWPFVSDGIKDGTAATAFCAGQPDAVQTDYCYQGVSSLVGRMSLDDPTHAAAACAHFLPQWQGMCYSYSAEAVLQENRTEASEATKVCDLAQEPARTQCFSHLLDHADFIFGKNKAQMGAFCAALPDPWRTSCSQRPQ